MIAGIRGKSFTGWPIETSPPTGGRIVVVRAGIDHRVNRVELREVLRGAIWAQGVTESPLQNSHARKSEVFSESRDRWRHGAEVFREKRKWSEVCLQCGE